MTADHWLLVVNGGSTSIKFAGFAHDSLALAFAGSIRNFPAKPEWRISKGPEASQPRQLATLNDALAAILAYAQMAMGKPPSAIGHRIVHGGHHFKAVRLNAALLAELRALGKFAPLHQPLGVEAAALTMAALPGAPNAAVFDTSFHHTLPEAEWRYPLPPGLAGKGIRRFGFHGISYQSVALRLRKFFGDDAGGRVVAAHLGGGSSLCAMLNGESRATTMGLTPAGGVPSATRSGDLDPGVVLALVRELGADGAENVLNRQSGLAALSGGTGDAVALLSANDTQGRLALDLYVRRVQQAIVAMAMAVGGLDVLVFTGGMGAHAPELRRRIVEGCGWLGLSLDPAANAANAEIISAPASCTKILRLEPEEEKVIARETARALVIQVKPSDIMV